MSTPPTISAATDQSTPSQLAISNGVLLAAVIFLFMVVLFVFLLYLYAKRFLGANPMLNPGHSSRFIFLADSPLPGRGLPAAVLRSLPVAVYSAPSPRAHKLDAPLECAVCLSEVAAGDKLRTLPKCGHRFHVDCIDMWFHSHDTCPLCRAPVGGAAADAEAGGGLPRVPREDPAGTLDLPTNVLFWGTHDDAHFTNTNANLIGTPPPPTNAASTTTSSSASGLRKDSQLVIDIPNRQGPIMMVLGASSPLPSSRDDLRSPMSARLRSLRRLLSRGKQAVAGTSSSSASPRGGGDIEQGLAARPPKTPPSSN